MPLLVKDVEWTETEQYVTIKLPLKGASTRNVDIFATNFYVKVSYPPYFYEAALFKEVNDDASKATIANGLVTFHLLKKQSEIWGQLHSSQSEDKNFLRELRENALIYQQAKEQKHSKRIAEEKDKRKKEAVREQMRLDREQMEEIQNMKKEETQKACEELENWKKQNEENIKRTKTVNTKPLQNSKQMNKEIVSKNEGDVNINNSNSNCKKKELPKPRSAGSIQVNFTPRMLATPARESKLPEEEIWLQKVAEMNKIRSKNVQDALDVEEMNPIWLKEKGNEFYQKGNYVAAINAYTSALLLDSKIPMIYSNRAACHLMLKQYRECIQDCTCALELYDPPVPANAMSRCRTLTRRGTANFNLEEYVDALKDYEAAIKLDPKNEALQLDARKIRRIIQGQDSSD